MIPPGSRDRDAVLPEGSQYGQQDGAGRSPSHGTQIAVGRTARPPSARSGTARSGWSFAAKRVLRAGREERPILCEDGWAVFAGHYRRLSGETEILHSPSLHILAPLKRFAQRLPAVLLPQSAPTRIQQNPPPPILPGSVGSVRGAAPPRPLRALSGMAGGVQECLQELHGCLQPGDAMRGYGLLRGLGEACLTCLAGGALGAARGWGWGGKGGCGSRGPTVCPFPRSAARLPGVRPGARPAGFRLPLPRRGGGGSAASCSPGRGQAGRCQSFLTFALSVSRMQGRSAEVSVRLFGKDWRESSSLRLQP